MIMRNTITTLYKSRNVLAAVILLSLLVITGYTALTQTGKPSAAVNKKDIPQEKADAGEQPLDINPAEEIDRLAKQYYADSRMSYKGSLKLYDENTDSSILMEEKPFYYASDKSGYYYNIGNVEIINQDDQLLYADHEQKLIAVVPHAPDKTSPHYFDMDAFRKLVKDGGVEAKVFQSGEGRMLTVGNIKEEGMKGYAIYYDPKTYRIDKIDFDLWMFNQLEYKDDEINNVLQNEQRTSSEEPADGTATLYSYRMSVVYAEIRQGVASSVNERQRKFITGQGKHIQLGEEYKEYELINQVK